MSLLSKFHKLLRKEPGMVGVKVAKRKIANGDFPKSFYDDVHDRTYDLLPGTKNYKARK